MCRGRIFAKNCRENRGRPPLAPTRRIQPSPQIRRQQEKAVEVRWAPEAGGPGGQGNGREREATQAGGSAPLGPTRIDRRRRPGWVREISASRRIGMESGRVGTRKRGREREATLARRERPSPTRSHPDRSAQAARVGSRKSLLQGELEWNPAGWAREKSGGSAPPNSFPPGSIGAGGPGGHEKAIGQRRRPGWERENGREREATQARRERPPNSVPPGSIGAGGPGGFEKMIEFHKNPFRGKTRNGGSWLLQHSPDSVTDANLLLRQIKHYFSIFQAFLHLFFAGK